MLSSGRRGEARKTQEINEIHEAEEIHVGSKGHKISSQSYKISKSVLGRGDSYGDAWELSKEPQGCSFLRSLVVAGWAGW